MVELIAKQSLDTKMAKKTSVITGNYEMYYLCGILSNHISFDGDGKTPPQELKEMVEKALEGYQAQDEGLAYIIDKFPRYVPGERYDEQMKDMFDWGKTGVEPKK